MRIDLDKARGVIFGLAIGDALGRLTEFISLPQIKAVYGLYQRGLPGPRGHLSNLDSENRKVRVPQLPGQKSCFKKGEP